MQSEGVGLAEKPALPVKRSKSMKVVSKPVSVIPVISVRGEPSFSRDEYSEYRYRSHSTKIFSMFPPASRQCCGSPHPDLDPRHFGTETWIRIRII
jgi:hypothetical protein